MVQTGHATAADAVALSPDAHVVVTGSADGTALLVGNRHRPGDSLPVQTR